jgi:hypothetical protein
VAAKSYHYILSLVLAGSMLRPAVADNRPEKADDGRVDLQAARALFLSQVPAVTWLVKETPRPLADLSLAEFVPAAAPSQVPTIEANSEQRQPMQLGASLREQLIYGRGGAGKPRLPSPLRSLAERQALRVLDRLLHSDEKESAEETPPEKRKKDARPPANAGRRPEPRPPVAVDFELWPTENDVGRLTWVFARYRKQGDGEWQWLDAGRPREAAADNNLLHEPYPILPEHYSPASRRGYIAIFRDFFAADTRDLYEKPAFSECVWTTADKTAVYSAWRKTVERSAQRAFFEQASDAEKRQAVCIALPQPAQVGGKPLVLHVRATDNGVGVGRVQFLEQVEWVSPPEGRLLPLPLRQALHKLPLPVFPKSFDTEFKSDVQMLSGVTPLPGGPRLSRRNNADPQHQLELLLDHLEASYKKLGWQTRRQHFTWRGIPQSNLIAILPAGDSGASPGNAPARPPVVLADHIDTAFCEDAFARDSQRISAPGADDNAAATATLMRAAQVLTTIPQKDRKHDIWLVHLTGEEFPADDLGARRLVEDLLGTRTDILAFLLLDMIGHNPRRQPEFQLNAGGYFEAGGVSVQLAQIAAQISGRVTPSLRPVVYPQTDLRNYLYNTDGRIFAEAGFPVVHVSEVMNRYLINRSAYHDTQDTMANLNVEYAASVARVAIATTAVLAQLGLPQAQPAPASPPAQP